MKGNKLLAFLLASSLALTSMPLHVFAAAIDGKPADGITYNQPFENGTAGSAKFRIPCLVTLDDGTIVTGCDARWTTHLDGGGLDTIVSRSTDRGRTWNYTFANYLGDNGNTHNRLSSAFIDPAMATDGKTVWLLADIFPAGYSLNATDYVPPVSANQQVGFNEQGHMVLVNTSSLGDNIWGSERSNYSLYTYSLVPCTNPTSEHAYNIVDSNGHIVEEYVVDAYYNIKGTDIDTNLFLADSPYQVWPTDYLYLTSSSDAGATWSTPTIINVKRQSEQTILAGPGRGIVCENGRLMFTVYEFSSGDRNSAVIYSDDHGKTWSRGESVPSQSSEAVVTEADGKIFMFTRHGGYYISSDGGQTWSNKKTMGISYNLDTQLTAITYSKKIDGKTAIIFACPSNTSSRSAGKIFVGLVEGDQIEWKYDYSINGNDFYAYSCIDEMIDGSLALLYESGDVSLTYKNMINHLTQFAHTRMTYLVPKKWPFLS